MIYTNKFDFDPGLFKDEAFPRFSNEPAKRKNTRSKMLWVLGLSGLIALVAVAIVSGKRALDTYSQKQKQALNTTFQPRAFIPPMPLQEKNSPLPRVFQEPVKASGFCNGNEALCTTTTTTTPAETLQILATAIPKDASTRYKIHLSVESIE